MKNDKNIKVFFLQEIIPNYRVPIFKRLSNLKNIDLTVFYSEPNRRFKLNNLKNAKNINGFKSVKLPLFVTKKSSYQFSFIKYLFLNRPDILISGKRGSIDALLFLLFCKILQVRFLWFSGGIPYIEESQIKEFLEAGRLTKLFGKYNPRLFINNKADGMVVYSEHAKNYYSSLGFKKKIFVAPNSPDTDKLLGYKKQIEKNINIIDNLQKKYSPNGEKIIFMLGRLNKERKTDILINTFEIVQGNYSLTTLIIIGDGSERSSLESMVEDKNLRDVYFLGAIYDDKILARYFILCDICITPLATLAIPMAMTFGKPVITGNYGLEVHSINNGEDGFIVDIDDSKAVAEKILLLLKDDDLKKKMSRNAKETILNKINIHKMIEGFEKAIYG